MDFSTIRINIQEVEKLRNTETLETTFGTKIKNAIEDSIFGFKNGLQNMVIGFIYMAPFLILLGIILFIVFRVVQKIRINKNNLDK